MKNLIGVKNLFCTVGNFTLRIDNFNLKEKEFHVLLGPTGNGKTLLLEYLIGLLVPSQGDFFLRGEKANHLPPEKRDIAYVPQDLALFPHLTVEENLKFALQFKPKNKLFAYEEALSQLVQALQIKHLLSRYPAKLSGGEKQRVALARALAAQPKLLLLDEPFSALHPSLKVDLWQLIKKLHQELNLTTLMVTHDVEEALALGEVISFIYQGKIQQTAKRREIYYHPKTLEVAEYFGLRNIYTGKIVQIKNGFLELQTNGIGRIKAAQAHYVRQLRAGDAVYWGIHPEEVTVVKADRRHLARENVFAATVANQVEAGRFRFLYLLLQAESSKSENITLQITIPDYISRRLNINNNELLEVQLKPEHIFIIRT